MLFPGRFCHLLCQWMKSKRPKPRAGLTTPLRDAIPPHIRQETSETQHQQAAEKRFLPLPYGRGSEKQVLIPQGLLNRARQQAATIRAFSAACQSCVGGFCHGLWSRSNRHRYACTCDSEERAGRARGDSCNARAHTRDLHDRALAGDSDARGHGSNIRVTRAEVHHEAARGWGSREKYDDRL